MKWIKVEARPPEQGDIVLTSDGVETFIELFWDGEFVNQHIPSERKVKASYWMPLPRPPEV